MLTPIARLLARIGVCRELLLKSAPLPAVRSWSRPDDEPEPPFDARAVEDDWRLVARARRDLEPSV